MWGTLDEYGDHEPNLNYLNKLQNEEGRQILIQSLQGKNFLQYWDHRQFSRLIDQSSNQYFNRQKLIRSKENKGPPDASNRARLLATLNPTLFKHQNKKGEITAAVSREYRQALAEYQQLRQQSNSI